MPKSPNKWKKPTGCSISTISLSSVLKLIFAGVVLRSQELLHALKEKKKAGGQAPGAVERFGGKKNNVLLQGCEEKRIK